MPLGTSTVLGSQKGSSGANFTFSYAGFSGRVTSAEVSASAATVDVSHLGLAKWEGTAPTGVRLVRAAPLSDSPELKVDFLANASAALPTVGLKNTFTLTGSGSSLTKVDVCTKAICTAASIKATVGDLVKGSCTFKFSKD